MTYVPLTLEIMYHRRQSAEEESTDSCIVQKIVIEAVCDVLEIDEVQPWQSFHSLGGHSLLNMYLASTLSQQLGMNVDVNTVFKAQSINQLVTDLHQLLTENQSIICCFS